MPGKVDRIQDEALRGSLADAQDALKAGDYKRVVELSSAAYVELLQRKPEMLQGQQQFMNVTFFPRLGAHLMVNNDGQPEIVWDREKFIFSEAVTYFEFTVDRLLKAGL
ncbi:MAG TPA: hypothetical protein VIW01_07995 [Dehalococcoidia bacterium]